MMRTAGRAHVPGHWRAVFGDYTQTLGRPSRIPAQVQCLRSLLGDREATVVGSTLAVVGGAAAAPSVTGDPEADAAAPPDAAVGRDGRARCRHGPPRRAPPGAAGRPASGPSGSRQRAPHLRRWGRQIRTGDPWCRPTVTGSPMTGKGSGGDRSGPRRARRRHEQGRGAGRRGHPRGGHQHHRQGHRARRTASRRASSSTSSRPSPPSARAVEAAERLSGLRLEAAFVGVGGSQVESLNSRGAVAVSGPHREVSREDVERATEVARAVTIPSNREVLPRPAARLHRRRPGGRQGPAGHERGAARGRDPHRPRLARRALQNLTKCVRQAGVRVDELVIASLASGEAVLSETERELGVAVADIGAGTHGPRAVHRGLALPHLGAAPRRQQRHQRRGHRAQDQPRRRRSSSSSGSAPRTRARSTRRGGRRRPDRRGRRPDRARLEVARDHRGAHARDLREDRRADARRARTATGCPRAWC